MGVLQHVNIMSLCISIVVNFCQHLTNIRRQNETIWRNLEIISVSLLTKPDTFKYLQYLLYKTNKEGKTILNHIIIKPLNHRLTSLIVIVTQ